MAEQARQIEDVRGSGVYPGSGPLPPGNAIVRSPAALGHPEQRPATLPISTQSLETPAFVAGRATFGGYFLYNGINHFLNRSMLVEYARAKGVRNPEAAVVGSGLLMIAGGLSIATGVLPKIGAGLIATFLLGASPRMHAFWREQDPQQRMNEMTNFTKNMALLGGTLIAAGHPEPWPAAVHRHGGRTGELVSWQAGELGSW
jgi:putative oxidoreductase